MRHLSTFLILLSIATSIINARTIRVLAIGNSFAEDAAGQHLHDLALAQGDTLIIGIASIGGCDLTRHADNLTNNKADYRYIKISCAGKSVSDGHTLDAIITDEPWKIITLQQASHYSGRQDSYDRLPELKRNIERLMPDKNAGIAWHQTWSYAKGSDHSGFKHYGNDQQAMTDSINATVAAKVIPAEISRIIPSGHAITLGRKLLGNSLTRDGYHLAYELGRYTAACVWCEFITGKTVVGNSYRPADISDQQALAAQLAAHAAF